MMIGAMKPSCNLAHLLPCFFASLLPFFRISLFFAHLNRTFVPLFTTPMAAKKRKENSIAITEANTSALKAGNGEANAFDENGWIEVTGAKEHNLKAIDIRIPREKLVVITGISGSGKSSLAFDTIYAEGQRRYLET